MLRHPPDDLVRFLREIDRHLAKSHQLIIIGGAAAALAYKASRTTSDIDTANALSIDFERAVTEAKKSTGLEIPVSYAAIADGPYNYETRLKRLRFLKTEKLEVLVPERHDLALMKIIRGEEHDIQVLVEMHESEPFDLEILIDRFTNEMRHVIGDHRWIRSNFVGLVEELFGETSGKDVDKFTENWELAK
jgi:hypothetical protein